MKSLAVPLKFYYIPKKSAGCNDPNVNEHRHCSVWLAVTMNPNFSMFCDVPPLSLQWEPSISIT